MHTPVALDFCHIRHATHAEAEVFPVQGTSNRAGNAGLPNPWRAIETEDLALCGSSQLADSNEFLGHTKERNRSVIDTSPALARKGWKDNPGLTF